MLQTSTRDAQLDVQTVEFGDNALRAVHFSENPHKEVNMHFVNERISEEDPEKFLSYFMTLDTGIGMDEKRIEGWRMRASTPWRKRQV